MRFDFLEVIEDSGSDVLRSVPGVSFEQDVNNTMGTLPGDATIRLERVLSDIVTRNASIGQVVVYATHPGRIIAVEPTPWMTTSIGTPARQVDQPNRGVIPATGHQTNVQPLTLAPRRQAGWFPIEAIAEP